MAETVDPQVFLSLAEQIKEPYLGLHFHGSKEKSEAVKSPEFEQPKVKLRYC